VVSTGNSTTGGSVKTKYHPWNYLTLILNIFGLEKIQFSEPSGYQDIRKKYSILVILNWYKNLRLSFTTAKWKEQMMPALTKSKDGARTKT